MKLYEINESLMNLLESMDPDELNFDLLMKKFQDKTKDICVIIKHFEAKAAEAKEEKNRVAAVQKYYENQTDRLKSYLFDNLQKQGVSTMEVGTYRLSLRESSSVVFTDENEIPDSYKETIETVKIDKNAIKAAWKSAAVPGTAIERRKSLQIK